MKRIPLLLAAAVTLALWLGVGTAFAGGLQLLGGGGGQQNSAVVVQNVASGNTVQGIGNWAGSNGSVASAVVDQTNAEGGNGPDQGQPANCRCQDGSAADDSSPNLAPGDPPPPPPGGQGSSSDQGNSAIVVQNVASGNTVQLIGNQAGSNGAVASTDINQQNAAGSTGDAKPKPDEYGKDGEGGVDGASRSNHALVVQNVASGNTVQGAFNDAGSNGAVASTTVDQQNESAHGSKPSGTWNGGDCGSCKQRPEPKPCPKPEPAPCPKPEPKPCPEPKPAPCPKPEPCPPQKPAPRPAPKPCPGGGKVLLPIGPLA